MRKGILLVSLWSLVVLLLFFNTGAAPADAVAGDTVVINGTSGNDTIVLSRSGSDLQCAVSGTPPTVITLSGIDVVQINGLGGADVLMLDFAGGSPIPPGGITYDGGDPSTNPGDSLIIENATGANSITNLTHACSGPHSGRLTIDGLTVDYSGLEPVDIRGSTVANLTLVLNPTAVDVAMLWDVATPTDGFSGLRSLEGTFETITFANPTESLTIRANGGDTVSIAPLEPSFATPSLVFDDASGVPSFFRLTGTAGYADNIPDSVDVTVSGGAVFDLYGHFEAIDGLSGNGTVTNTDSAHPQVLTVGAGGASSTFSGVITNEMAAMLSLSKVGAGTLTLTGTSTYSGTTHVVAGTLLMNGDNPTPSGGIWAVSTSATLGGTGTIRCPIQCLGTLAPGSGGIGTLTCTFDVMLLTGIPQSTVAMELNKSGATCTSDRLFVSGQALTYAGTLTVTASGDALAGGDVFNLFDATPSTGSPFSGAFSTMNLPVLPAGLQWKTSNLLVDGTISVVDTSDPVITVVKSAPDSILEGETVTYTFTIYNASPAVTDPVSITSVVDDVLGDLTSAAHTAWHAQGLPDDHMLPPGDAFAFSHTTGPLSVGTVVNHVTVTAYDDEGVQTTMTDTHILTVTNVNDAPTSGNATVATVEDAWYVFTLADFPFTDPDVGDTLAAVKVTTLEAAGALRLNGADVTLNQGISAADISAGRLTFDPAPGASGTPYTTFAFVVSDGVLYSAPAYTMTINVGAVNDPPVFISVAEFLVDENTFFVTRAVAADLEGDRLIYSIAGGPDASLFNIDPWSGDLRFLTAPDYEHPADAGKDNIYSLTVQVSDGAATAAQALVVRVVNVAEVPVSHSPIITSDGGGDTAALEVPENTTAVTNVQATDPDAGALLTFSIMGGSDADKFQIDPAGGALSFVTAPDYERPTDVGRDNIYRITVRVSDGTNADIQVLTIAVTDVAEQSPPPVTNRWNDITDAEWESTYGVTAAEVDRVADGGSDGGFHPATPITRGQFAKMVMDGFGLAKAASGPPTFSDVLLNHVFFAWIQGGADLGVLTGLDDGTFAPAKAITRPQASSIVGRYLVLRELASAGSIKGAQGTYPTLEAWFAAEGAALLAPFADAESLAAVHAPYTAYLVHTGVIQGTVLGGAYYLMPLGDLTRAQAAAMIVRASRVSFGGL